MRRRWGLFVSLLTALALVAAACGGGDDPTIEPGDDNGGDNGGAVERLDTPTFEAGTTMAELQSRGRVVVGTKFDQPLFGLANPLTGEVEGFDVEIAKLIAMAIFGGDLENIGDRIQFEETVSRNREPYIQEGRVDFVVATYTINDTRKQVVAFAGPYYIAGQDIMVRRGDTSIRSVDDLNGKKVCSVVGSTSINNVQERAPQADISISFDRYSLCAEALKDGRVEAVTTDNIILLGLINDDPQSFQLVGNPFTEEPYGIGIRHGDDAFRDFINDRLEAIYRNGQWRAAFERTVGESGEAAPTPPPVDRY